MFGLLVTVVVLLSLCLLVLLAVVGHLESIQRGLDSLEVLVRRLVDDRFPFPDDDEAV